MMIIFSSAIYKVLCDVRHFTHANNLVEASLIGFSLLLGMLICGLHYSVARHYMLRILRGALLQELASP
ncbi:hypothetical protein EUGRSUZ_F03481 [Eucalyptus grandis]|uniref:Uncharacterized protein n=2 Tax=Eucalyptus grandis TaxID=71139 RepID=A0A059BVR1_EUCGR|nr:hypothetical protein EUGRSUZ_F03481 [Eucalyptus grandis]